MEDLIEEMDGVFVHDPEKEYEKLTYSQEFSVDELLMASHKVISSCTNRYKRYLKYIKFTDSDDSNEPSLIKTNIINFFSRESAIEKIILVKKIDKMLIDFIQNKTK